VEPTLTIGDFSRATHLSVKMLRHYHNIGLLEPAGVDPDTGYRATPSEANRKIIRQAFEAWHKGTGAMTKVFAADMVWRIEGHSVASKEYTSKQQLIDEVLRPFGARFTTSDPGLVSSPFRPDFDAVGRPRG
jgi:hypothetical protein